MSARAISAPSHPLTSLSRGSPFSATTFDHEAGALDVQRPEQPEADGELARLGETQDKRAERQGAGQQPPGQQPAPQIAVPRLVLVPQPSGARAAVRCQEARAVEDGHVLSRRTYPPSWSDAPPQSPPPTDVAGLRAYLQEAAYSRTALNTGELLDTVASLLDTWTLGARESATLARLLADTEGLRPLGQMTDRLGRRGQVYVYEGSGSRRMLIMDPATGTVLGLETTFTTAEPEYGVKAGDVMSYRAWMR